MYLNLQGFLENSRVQPGLTVTWDVFELGVKETLAERSESLTVTWDVFEQSELDVDMSEIRV